MKVYVIEWWDSRDGSFINKAFSTYNKAKEYLETEDEICHNYTDVYIHEMEVE